MSARRRGDGDGEVGDGDGEVTRAGLRLSTT